MKRKRRTFSDIREIRDRALFLVRENGRMSLSELVEEHAQDLCIRNTPSDRSLLRRQLNLLDEMDLIDLVRVGRGLIARNKPDVRSGELQETENAIPEEEQSPMSQELAAIRAYAVQLEEFSRSLQEQISILVRMIDKTTR